MLLTFCLTALLFIALLSDFLSQSVKELSSFLLISARLRRVKENPMTERVMDFLKASAKVRTFLILTKY